MYWIAYGSALHGVYSSKSKSMKEGFGGDNSNPVDASELTDLPQSLQPSTLTVDDKKKDGAAQIRRKSDDSGIKNEKTTNV